mmetsp:Transcript_15740/g.26544  ORF Transcript_15740/g.26544 Transcript_15740/m.26544 type:complete len:95 (+) Transcript_15740:278-562(+)
MPRQIILAQSVGTVQKKLFSSVDTNAVVHALRKFMFVTCAGYASCKESNFIKRWDYVKIRNRPLDSDPFFPSSGYLFSDLVDPPLQSWLHCCHP